jgi:hypothetical protein
MQSVQMKIGLLSNHSPGCNDRDTEGPTRQASPGPGSLGGAASRTSAVGAAPATLVRRRCCGAMESLSTAPPELTRVPVRTRPELCLMNLVGHRDAGCFENEIR